MLANVSLSGMRVVTGKKSVKPLFSRVRVMTSQKSLFLTYACYDV